HVHPGAKPLGRSSEAGVGSSVSAAKLALEFRLVHRRAAADVAAAGLRVELVVGGAVGTGVGALATPVCWRTCRGWRCGSGCGPRPLLSDRLIVGLVCAD